MIVVYELRIAESERIDCVCQFGAGCFCERASDHAGAVTAQGHGAMHTVATGHEVRLELVRNLTFSGRAA